MSWSKHRHASYYLAAVSFIEASFFPIPPDVMLIPMVLSEPKKVWRFAFIATIASVLGGIFGYLIGYFAFELIEPIINAYGYQTAYHQVMDWFSRYGFFAVVFAGFTPIPYKMFTIASGALQLALPLFILASILGRGLRFFMVAYFVCKVGKPLEPMIAKYVEIVGWGVVAAVTLLLLILMI